jgi:hypothetical protein
MSRLLVLASTLLLFVQALCAAECPTSQYTVKFFLRYDALPSETAYSLTCDNNVTYFEAARGTGVAFTQVDEQLCIDNTATCYLVVSDSNRDGLTSKDGVGQFNCSVDGITVVSYTAVEENTTSTGLSDGPIISGDFEVVHVCFGAACPEVADSAAAVDVGAGYDRCEDLVFTLLLDEFPEEVAYSLVCDGVKLWDRGVGYYDSSRAFEMIEEVQMCVMPIDTCTLTITDTDGDGLSAVGFNARAGFFFLTYGTNMVAFYDGSDSKDAAYYSELSFCFGPGDCPEARQKQQQVDGMASVGSCDRVQLQLTLDESPLEVGFQLTCGEVVVWDVPFGTYTAMQQFETVVTNACVDRSSVQSCCKFTMYDSHGDGLTSPQNKLPGEFELLWEGRSLVWYDGSDANAAYAKLEYTVGPLGCV